MEKGTDPNFIHHTIFSSKRKEIVTALHIAVDLGHYDTVQVLLDANADCNIGDHNHETPLHIATKKADKVMVRMLLSKGADPSIPDRKGNAALHIATLYGHLQLVRSLLKYDADVYQKGQWGTIPPHIAAKEGHIHLIQLFCSRDVGNINIKIPCYPDKREKAPIHLAAENGHVETVLALLDQFDADVNQRDSDGNTPLHCVVLNQYNPHRMRDKEYFSETARVLLKYRVGINEKNIYGDTALHLAAMNQFQRVVELLLAIGANPFAENDEHLKPIDVVPDFDPVTKQILKNAMLNPKQPLSASLASFRNELELTPASSQMYLHHRTRKYSENGYIDENRDPQTGRIPGSKHHNMSYVSQSTLSQSMDSVFDEYPNRHRPRSASQGRDQQRPRPVQKSRQPEPQPEPSPPQQRREQKRQQPLQPQGQRSKHKRPQAQYEDDYDPMYDDVEDPYDEPMYAKPEKKSKPKQVSSSSMQTDPHRMRSMATQHADDDSISLSSSKDGTAQAMSTGIPDSATMNAELKRIIQEQRKQLQMYEDQTYSEMGSLLDHSMMDSEKPYRPLALKKERPRPSPRSSTRSTSSMRPIPAERSHTPSSMGSRTSPTFHDHSRGEQPPKDSSQQQQSHYQNADAIRVNQVPGKPGTIEVSYGGGPISISVDPHSMQYQIQRQQQEQAARSQQDDEYNNQYPSDYRNVDPPDYSQRHHHREPPDRRQYPPGQGAQYQGGDSYGQDFNEDGMYDSTEMESQQSYSVHSTDREVVSDAIKHSVFEVMGHRTLDSAQDSYQESPLPEGVEKPQPKTKPVAQKRSKTPTSEQKSEGFSLPPEPQHQPYPSRPPQALHVGRADGSVSHEDDIEASPDTTPNASPQFKSFSEKMAMFKQQEAQSQETTPQSARKHTPARGQDEATNRNRVAPEIQPRWGLSQRDPNSQTGQDLAEMVATPEVSQWKVQSGETAVVEHTTEIEEYEGSPAALRRTKRMDYTPQNTDRESSYMASAQINSSYGEESESDEEEVSQAPALIKASQHPYESHDQYYSIAGDVDINSEVNSAAQTPRTAPTQVTQTARPAAQVTQRTAQESPPVTEPYKVSSSEGRLSESGVEFTSEPGEQGVNMYEYEEEPGSRRLNLRRHKVASPVSIEVTPSVEELRSAGAKTPDSAFSDSDSRRSGSLNMRVTGEVPKSYNRASKGSARKAFMLHKPEGIESCSEGSDVESSSLRRLRSRSETDRLSRYSEPVASPHDSAPEEPEKEPASEHAEDFSAMKNPALKLRGPLPKPYKSFGKIEPKIDALLDALEENAAETQHRAQLEARMEEPSGIRVGNWVQQSEPTQVSTENLSEGFVSPTRRVRQEVAKVGQEPGLEDSGVVGRPSHIAQIASEIHYIDSDEGEKRVAGVRARQADASLAEPSFKKNLKMSESTPESYDDTLVELHIEASETVKSEMVKIGQAPQAAIVELDEVTESSTDFDEDREAQSYGEGPKIAGDSQNIRRPPKPKLMGDQPRKNRHSIESEVETIPIDPEFIIEEPKKKKPPRPKVVHPIQDNENQAPCPIAQQVSSNFNQSQQSKSPTHVKTGRLTPRSTLAVLAPLEEQSESDMSEAYDQEPSRRIPKGSAAKSTERQITKPEDARTQPSTQPEPHKDAASELSVQEPVEFERFGSEVKNRSSGIEADVRSSKSVADDHVGDLERYDQEPGARRRWGSSKQSEPASEDSQVSQLERGKPQFESRGNDRPTGRPPLPQTQEPFREDTMGMEVYDDEPGSRRPRQVGKGLSGPSGSSHSQYQPQLFNFITKELDSFVETL